MSAFNLHPEPHEASHRVRLLLRVAIGEACDALLRHVRQHGVQALPEDLRGPARRLQEAHDALRWERSERDG